MIFLSGVLRGILRIYVYIAYRPKIIYESRETRKYIKHNPVIFIPNHVSAQDGPVCYFLFPNSALMVAKDWYEKKWIRFAIYSRPAISLDRHNLDTAWIKDAVAMIKDGKNVFIFPEGHTNKTGEIADFKAGFAMLSVMTKAPVVPLYINGEYNVLLGKRLRIYVGEPRDLSSEGKGMNSVYLNGECERFRNIVVAMKNKYD
ncbi:MAG: 1-acyl-sn-glycerol-3-phosphate acyltransferase [Lachnospiraceae bacterium]|nr:1-acyl-sn-glycerol-3-phosphate acyltransferase [Lachnospiraceae bacterium]